jgi:hypothetical protein
MRKIRAAWEDGIPDSLILGLPDPLPEGDEAGADELLAVDCFRGGKHLV